jgi:hypothetical protein
MQSVSVGPIKISEFGFWHCTKIQEHLPGKNFFWKVLLFNNLCWIHNLMFYIIKRFVLSLPILELDKVDVAVVLHVVLRLHCRKRQRWVRGKSKVFVFANIKYFIQNWFIICFHRWYREFSGKQRYLKIEKWEIKGFRSEKLMAAYFKIWVINKIFFIKPLLTEFQQRRGQEIKFTSS